VAGAAPRLPLAGGYGAAPPAQGSRPSGKTPDPANEGRPLGAPGRRTEKQQVTD
jgi:hypothetical protein